MLTALSSEIFLIPAHSWTFRSKESRPRPCRLSALNWRPSGLATACHHTKPAREISLPPEEAAACSPQDSSTLATTTTSTSPRLVISSDGSTGDYIALSHCWGSHQPLTTTTATLAARQAAIPLASMPLTFQHALLVTRKLGFRHIWIDSLCIIQDSRSGWKEQAAKMQHVYEGAILTIAADAGNKNSASGLTCADKRQRFRGVGLNGEAVRAAPAAMSGETPAHFVKWTAKVPTRQEDEGSALQTRGWTFQERVLARRVLHFGEYEMAWECAASIACECGSGRSGWKGWARHDTMYNARWCADASPLLVHNGGASVDFSQRWMAIVNKYSVRDLTYSSDKLVALAGLAARAASCSAWDYLAGHWRQDLEATLLWTAGGMPLLGGEEPARRLPGPELAVGFCARGGYMRQHGCRVTGHARDCGRELHAPERGSSIQ